MGGVEAGIKIEGNERQKGMRNEEVKEVGGDKRRAVGK